MSLQAIHSVETDAIALVQETCDTLEANGVRYGFWSGKEIELKLSNLQIPHRSSVDYDFLIADEDMPIVRSIFPNDTLFTGNNDRQIVRRGPDDIIELMSHMDVTAGGYCLPIRMTKLVEDGITVESFGDLENIRCLKWEETVHLKGVLQRTKGKHDIEDIMAVQRHVDLDLDYLHKRIVETGSYGRVAPLFMYLGTFATRQASIDYAACS